MSDYKKLRDMDEFYEVLEEMKRQLQLFYESVNVISVYSFDDLHDRDSIYDFLCNWAATKYKTFKIYRDHNIMEDEYYLIFAAR